MQRHGSPSASWSLLIHVMSCGCSLWTSTAARSALSPPHHPHSAPQPGRRNAGAWALDGLALLCSVLHLRRLLHLFGVALLSDLPFSTFRWALIASKMQVKGSKQCRRRWQNYLNAEVKQGGWSTEEVRARFVLFLLSAFACTRGPDPRWRGDSQPFFEARSVGVARAGRAAARGPQEGWEQVDGDREDGPGPHGQRREEQIRSAHKEAGAQRLHRRRCLYPSVCPRAKLTAPASRAG